MSTLGYHSNMAKVVTNHIKGVFEEFFIIFKTDFVLVTQPFLLQGVITGQ